MLEHKILMRLSGLLSKKQIKTIVVGKKTTPSIYKRTFDINIEEGESILWYHYKIISESSEVRQAKNNKKSIKKQNLLRESSVFIVSLV